MVDGILGGLPFDRRIKSKGKTNTFLIHYKNYSFYGNENYLNKKFVCYFICYDFIFLYRLYFLIFFSYLIDKNSKQSVCRK